MDKLLRKQIKYLQAVVDGAQNLDPKAALWREMEDRHRGEHADKKNPEQSQQIKLRWMERFRFTSE